LKALAAQYTKLLAASEGSFGTTLYGTVHSTYSQKKLSAWINYICQIPITHIRGTVT